MKLTWCFKSVVNICMSIDSLSNVLSVGIWYDTNFQLSVLCKTVQNSSPVLPTKQTCCNQNTFSHTKIFVLYTRSTQHFKQVIRKICPDNKLSKILHIFKFCSGKLWGMRTVKVLTDLDVLQTSEVIKTGDKGFFFFFLTGHFNDVFIGDFSSLMINCGAGRGFST